MRRSAEPGALLARPLKFAPLLWAWLWRRPGRTLLAVLAATCAFTLYGLAAGTVMGVQRMATAAHVETGPGLLVSAAGLCAMGFGLILFLTANATAQGVRLRIGEFGVLKAIGYSHGLILILVMAETVLPWLAGAVLGLALARPLLPRIIALLPFPAGLPGGFHTPAMIGGAILLALLLGAASAVVPALRIVRLDVAAALAGGLRERSTAPTLPAKAATTRHAIPDAQTPRANIWRHVPKADQHPLRQVAMVTRMGLATLPQRWKGAMAVAMALMVVTLVMNPLLILIDSFKGMMAVQGSPMHVMVTQADVYLWRLSRFPTAWTKTIKQLPGLAHMADGTPIVEARTYADVCAHPEARPGERGCIGLDGLEDSGAALRPPPLLLAGRRNRPGTHEIIMAANSAAQHGAKVGTRFHLQNQDWLVTGIFESKTFWVQGSAFGDATLIRSASGQDYDSFVVGQLVSPQALQTFRAALRKHPEIKVDAFREDDFYNSFAHRATHGWVIVCYIVGALFGVGAGAGIFHLMQVTVEARMTEMAVLRAIGFGEVAVATSVVLEAMLLAASGALAGMLVLWLWLDGTLYRGSLVLTVVWGRVAVAAGWSLAIALLGASSPALGAARMDVAEALRR